MLLEQCQIDWFTKDIIINDCIIECPSENIDRTVFMDKPIN